MRIIAGEWRGRPLIAPDGAATRPTADRVRETLFSMLASRLGSLEDLLAADLFAGSGALGLEALSRGAGHCLFVDQDRHAIAAIRANVERLGAGARAEVRPGQAERVTPERPLDLVFLDPPYLSGLASRALGHLAQRGRLAEGAVAAVETARQGEAATPGFDVIGERVIGKAKLTLLRLTSRVVALPVESMEPDAL